MDYCHFCAIHKKAILGKQQVINRLRQACGATENIHQAESEKVQIKAKLKKHKDEARESMLIIQEHDRKMQRALE